MAKKPQKPHFANGLISDMRDNAQAADRDIIKKAIKESSKAKVGGKTQFTKLSRKKANKLLALC